MELEFTIPVIAKTDPLYYNVSLVDKDGKTTKGDIEITEVKNTHNKVFFYLKIDTDILNS